MPPFESGEPQGWRGGAPSDPCAPSVGWIWVGWHDDLEGAIIGWNTKSTPRATLMKQVANELGIGFTDVTAHVRYARCLTRQEVWDNSGRDGWLDQWLHDNKVGYYFDTKDYRYDCIMADGSPRPNVQVPSAMLKKAEIPEAKEPPEDWVLPENAAMIEFVDPTVEHPTPVERVLVINAK